MPPKRKAATAAKAPAARRQRKPAEETVTVEVPGSRQDWLAPLHDMYTKREMYDIVLTVGDHSIFAHRVVLAMASKMWRAEFGRSGMAESKSKEVEVGDVSFAALKAIVDFTYTGNVELSGSSVVAIIKAANLLQVDAVERAAVQFLVERLDAGNVLSAMALGEHLSAGKIGRDLQKKSRAWVNKNFGLLAPEPSFLQLPVAELAGVVESDDLATPEEKIFAAVMAWVKEDEAARKAELGRLLPLIRFPFMDEPAMAIAKEPLVVAQHPLSFQLLLETHPEFSRSAEAANCPRLRPRKMKQPLAFTRASEAHYDLSGGALLRLKQDGQHRAAVCGGDVMAGGRHAVEFTVVDRVLGQQIGQKDAGYFFLGMARPGIDEEWIAAYSRDQFWGIYSTCGHLFHNAPISNAEHASGRQSGAGKNWPGRGAWVIQTGDTVGLLLDCDAGTLTVKMNGTRLGEAATGLTGEFCWAAALGHKDTQVSIKVVPAAEF
jgi:hypothetical protein